MACKPWGCISFELFADRVPRTAENLDTVVAGEKGFGYGASAFTELFQDLCPHVVTSHVIMVLVASPPTGRNTLLRTSPSSIQILAFGSSQMLDCGSVPSSSSVLPSLGAWKANIGGLWEGEEEGHRCHGALQVQEWQASKMTTHDSGQL